MIVMKNNVEPMRGIYKIVISTKRLKYKFELKSKITILTGDSATGKSSLYNVLQQLEIVPEGGSIESSVPIRIIPKAFGRDSSYITYINDNPNTILVIDESFHAFKTKEFCSVLKEANCYFILITRKMFEMLSYRPEDIFIVKMNKLGENTFEPLYTKGVDYNEACCPDKLIVEDSGSGYEFFKNLCNNDISKCIAARGNSNMYSTLRSSCKAGERALAIADAWGFGAHLESFLKLRQYNKYNLFLYESFEWLLLQSEMFKNDADVQQALKEPWNYFSAITGSWEREYYDLLKKKTECLPRPYSKSKLPICFLENCCKQNISNCNFLVKNNKIDSILTGVFDNIDFSKVRANTGKINDSEYTKMSLQ